MKIYSPTDPKKARVKNIPMSPLKRICYNCDHYPYCTFYLKKQWKFGNYTHCSSWHRHTNIKLLKKLYRYIWDHKRIAMLKK